MATVDVPAAMAGSICDVLVAVGDAVDEGQEVVVLESMKMEIPVITEDAGTVKEILVKEKDPVAEGQVVAILEE